MRRTGDVVDTAQGLLVCRADGEVEIGTLVIDDSLDPVGRIVDVFGPVERPYFAVTPHDDVHPPRLVGERLYAR